MNDWISVKNNNTVMGYSLRQNDCLLFFGTRHTSLADLKSLYPELEFQTLHQVHGNKIVPASGEIEAQADGHWTDKLNVALVIKSADCMPILCAHKHNIFALHAGWRGVASGICTEFVDHVRTLNLIPTDFSVAIGPHIGAKSFVVGLDVADKLKESYLMAGGLKAEDIAPSSQPATINLYQIARQQLHSFTRVIRFDRDTFSDQEFFSFRRDKPHTGRQYSFIAKIRAS